MNNPFTQSARLLISFIKRLPPDEWEDAVASIIAAVSTKSQEAYRARAQVFEISLPFARDEIEALDNADAWMKIESAKALGLGLLENPAVCLITRKMEVDKVLFTVKVALVPKQDW